MNGVRLLVRAAIGQVGGSARLLREGVEGPEFPASLQPLPKLEEKNTPIGTGAPHRVTLHAPCGTGADELVEGDAVVYLGRRYYVAWVETFYFQDEAIYRKAVMQTQTGEG